MFKPPELKLKPDMAKVKRHLWKLPELLIYLIRWPFFLVVIVSMAVIYPIIFIYDCLGDLAFWFNQKRMNVRDND